MKCFSFLSKCLHLICLFITGLIFILNLICTSSVSYDTAEKVHIHSHIIQSLLLLLLAALVIFSISFFKKYIETWNPFHLFLVLCVLYSFMAYYLISHVDPILRADTWFVSNAAKEFLSGSSASCQKGGYLYLYPHQIGLALYDAFLYLFTDHTAVHFIANTGFVFGINFLILKTTDLLFKNQFVTNLSIIMTFAFFPQFFFILFAYGTIPGLFFLLFSFYHTLCFCKKNGLYHFLLAVLGSCTAVVLRKNFLIGILAITIFLCLYLLKTFAWKRLALVICILFSMLLPLRILPHLFLDEQAGMPSVLWLAMGTDINNTVSGPGWYDNSSMNIYTDSGYDAGLAQKNGEEKLIQNLKNMIREPRKTGQFFVQKIISQWCDPLYQSIWVGPLEDQGQYTHTSFLKSLYNDGLAEDLLSGFMKLYLLIFFGFLFVFLRSHAALGDEWPLFFLLFIGGFLFHIFWEAKSQYIYPYIFPLIPFASFALSKCLSKLEVRSAGCLFQIRTLFKR